MENIYDFTGNVFSCGNITAQKLPASLGSKPELTTYVYLTINVHQMSLYLLLTCWQIYKTRDAW